MIIIKKNNISLYEQNIRNNSMIRLQTALVSQTITLHEIFTHEKKF